jgi:TetR/AcrR family transcriptional regulator, cholesterol catabolism regulator
MAKRSKPKGKRAGEADGKAGRAAIIAAAAEQFALAGYDATTMRDIASSTGLLPGSLYYYFPSKEELFCAVHETAIERICENVRRSVDESADPWTQLEQACTGYLESMLLKPDAMYAGLIVAEFPRRRSRELRKRLIEHRNRFEGLFTRIVTELPLKPGTSRSYWRLALLGMMAWTYVWYSPEGDSPAVVARKLIDLLRGSTDDGKPGIGSSRKR